MNISIQSLQKKLQDLTNRLDILTQRVKVPNNTNDLDNIYLQLQQLSSRADQLEQLVNNQEPITSADNELYFILQGSYVLESEIDSLVDGTY